MFYLKCTGDVQKALGLRKENLADVEPHDLPLGNWYVNRFNLGRRKAYIFMSESTLLSFLILQGKTKATQVTLPLMLVGGLEQLLQMRGYPVETVERVLAFYQTGFYAKTGSRADLSCLNDLVSRYQWLVLKDGGIESCDLTNIIMRVNDTPQRRLDWNNPWDATEGGLLII